MTRTLPPPGSPAARAKGCTCPAPARCDDQLQPRYDVDCPFHRPMLMGSPDVGPLMSEHDAYWAYGGPEED